MDIRTVASLASIALIGVGAYRVAKGHKQLVAAAAELDHAQELNRHKLGLLDRIDELRDARAAANIDLDPKSKFDNGRVLEGTATKG